MVLNLSKEIIKDKRQYYIDKVKTPLRKAIVLLSEFKELQDKKALLEEVAEIAHLCSLYPVPTRENCKWPNAHVLMDIWDKFFEYEDNPAHPDPEANPDFGREPLFRAMERITIGEYEHDHYYRDRMDWWVEELVKAYLSGEWHPRMPIKPDRRVCWNEPVNKNDLLEWVNSLVPSEVNK